MASPLNLSVCLPWPAEQPALLFESKATASAEFTQESLSYQALMLELERFPKGPKELISINARPRREELLLLLARLHYGLPTLLMHPALSKEAQAELTQRALSVKLHPEALVILATSGSSGQPKLVQLGGQQLKAAAKASVQLHPFLTNDRWLFALPYAHVGGLCILIRCLLYGACVVFPQNKHPAAIKRLKITIASLVPTQLFNWLESGVNFEKSSLRYQLIGGAGVQKELLLQAKGRGLNPLRTYGMTETCAQVATEASFLAGMRTLEDVELLIRDGEVAVRAPQMMLGYLGTAALNRDQYFFTGDSGTLADNSLLEINGRKDATFISGGENVSPQWVEEQVGAIRGIRQWALTWLADSRWGQAAVLLYSSETNAPATLKSVADAFKNVPAFARPKELIQVGQLPLTESGKWARSKFHDLAVQWQKGQS